MVTKIVVQWIVETMIRPGDIVNERECTSRTNLTSLEGASTVTVMSIKLLSLQRLLLPPTASRSWRRRDYASTVPLEIIVPQNAKAKRHATFATRDIIPRYATNLKLKKQSN